MNRNAMIEVQGLTKYYGPIRAIYDLSFTIEEGQIVGFLGLNGAGKSTALKILAGFLLPTAGSARVGGIDIVAEPEQVRARIGFLPERPPLYDEMTVTAFLRYLGKLRGMSGAEVDARLPVVLDQCALLGWEHRQIGTLSQGFRKRVGIAQAILHDPAFVLLDEPISGLDPVQIVEMRRLIRGLRGKHTVLISSHILTEVQETCDLLLLLRDGELVAQGSEEEVEAMTAPANRIEVEVRGDSSQAANVLAQMKEVESVDLLHSEGDIHGFEVKMFHADSEAIAACVVAAGLGLRRLEPHQNELETAFLSLVGGKEASP